MQRLASGYIPPLVSFEPYPGIQISVRQPDDNFRECQGGFFIRESDKVATVIHAADLDDHANLEDPYRVMELSLEPETSDPEMELARLLAAESLKAIVRYRCAGPAHTDPEVMG